MTEIQKAIKYFDGYGSPYDDLVVEALRKQMPMKVTGIKTQVKARDVETNEIMTYDCMRCPNCGKWLSQNYKYCSYCGQKLDWEVDND